MEFEITEDDKCTDCWCYGEFKTVQFSEDDYELVENLKTKGYFIRITDNGYIVGMIFNIECPNNCWNCNCTDDYTFGGYENNPYVMEAINVLLENHCGDLE